MRITGWISFALACSLYGCTQSTDTLPLPVTTHVYTDAGTDTNLPAHDGTLPGDTGVGPKPDTGTPSDGRVDDSGPGTDVFAGAPPFVPQIVPPSVLTLKHLFGGAGKAQTGQNCMECHDGTMAKAPLMAFGGTVYYTPGDTQGVPGAEVRVIDAKGVTTVVYTDADGDFWQLGDPKAFAWPAHTGVRNAKDAISMDGDFKDAGCNMAACHDGTASAPRITLPGP